MRLTRRQAAALAPAAMALAVLGRRPAAASEAFDAFAGGVAPTPGRVTLDLPELAEDGASVPLAVSVESPMTETDHVVALLVLAEGNPAPKVAEFRFGPENARAAIRMRIRLGGDQTVTAVARMSDGSLWSASRAVRVAVGGCVV